MIRQLIRLLLVTQFGKGVRQPKTAAWWRLLVILVVAVSVGLVAARLVWRFEALPDLPATWAESFIALAVWVVSGLWLLSMGAPQAAQQSRAAVGRVMAVLPLSQPMRWILRTGPLGIMVGAAGCCLMPIAVALADGFGLPKGQVLMAASLGLFAGFGAAASAWPRSTALRLGILLLLAAGGVRSLTGALNLAPSSSRLIALGVDACLLALGCYGAIQSYRGRQDRLEQSRVVTPRQLPKQALWSWWFLAKLVRNHRTLSSWAFCSTLTVGATVLLHVRHIVVANPAGWMLFGGVIAALFVADVRGLCRLRKPPEIGALAGARYLVLSELQAAFCGCLAIGLPLLGIPQPPGSMTLTTFALLFVSIQVAASSIGLLASTIFVPRAGAVGLQFFAGFVPAALLVAVDHFAHITQLSIGWQALSWLTIGVAGVGLADALEAARTKRYGHA